MIHPLAAGVIHIQWKTILFTFHPLLEIRYNYPAKAGCFFDKNLKIFIKKTPHAGQLQIGCRIKNCQVKTLLDNAGLGVQKGLECL